MLLLGYFSGICVLFEAAKMESFSCGFSGTCKMKSVRFVLMYVCGSSFPNVCLNAGASLLVQLLGNIYRCDTK